MTGLREELITEQAKKIYKVYKISPQEAKRILDHKLNLDHKLSALAAKSDDINKIYRTKLFKDFIKKVKKEIYYDLRTYQQQSSSLIDSHISSRERAPYIKDLFVQIDGYLKQARLVLDLGGGLFPASFPFQDYPDLQTYVWVDKDKQAYEKLKQEDLPKTMLYNFHLDENPWHYYLPDNKKEFDFVFMLKLIPVMHRQHREQLSHIEDLPFKYALITGSKEAMVKKQDIQNRENKVLTNFISRSNWHIIKKIDLPNEFGYLVE